MGTVPQSSPIPAGLASCPSVHTYSGYVCVHVFQSLHLCVFTSCVYFTFVFTYVTVCVLHVWLYEEYIGCYCVTPDYFMACCYSDGGVL